MIAEKTADAIKGRKLTPFEPPTRIAAGANYAPRYSAPRPQQYAASSAIYSKQQQPVVQPAAYHHYDSGALHPAYPPPIGQINSYQLKRTLEELSALNATSGDSISMLDQQQQQHLQDFDATSSSSNLLLDASASDQHFISSLPSPVQQKPIVTGKSSSRLEKKKQQLQQQLKQKHEFILKRYAASSMVDNLIKRIGPIR